jgi:hypothetical protein
MAAGTAACFSRRECFRQGSVISKKMTGRGEYPIADNRKMYGQSAGQSSALQQSLIRDTCKFVALFEAVVHAPGGAPDAA